jgi:hypothetical protein
MWGGVEHPALTMFLRVWVGGDHEVNVAILSRWERQVWKWELLGKEVGMDSLFRGRGCE